MHFAASGIIPVVAIIPVVEFGRGRVVYVVLGALWALTFLALRARDVANQPPSGE